MANNADAPPLARAWLRPVVAALGLIFCLHFFFFAFAHPLVDDFCRAGKARDLGFLQANIAEYTGWNGRWVGNGVAFLAWSVSDLIAHYRLHLVAIDLVFMAAFYVLVRVAFGEAAGRKTSAGLTGGLFALYWAGMTQPGETFYWFSGAVEYHLNLALAIFLLAALIRLPSFEGAGRKLLAGGALTLAAVVVNGFHELHAVALCVALAIGCGAAFRLRHPNRWLWAATLAGAAAGLAIMLAAPGNAVRNAHFPDRMHLPTALRVAVPIAIKRALAWTLDVRLLSATVLALYLPGLRRRPSWLANPAIPWRRVLPTAWIVLLGLAFLAPVLGTGRPMPARILNSAYLFFLVGWFLNLAAWLPDEPGRQAIDFRSVLIARGAALLLAFSLMTSGNTRIALTDLYFRPPWEYDRLLDRRYAAIREQAEQGRSEAVIPELPFRPYTYMLPATGADPDFWGNRCLARYFGAPAVRRE